ncbi:alcohol dehydrogenase family protein [Celeribacter halophilus]|uniref:alcohol dehydrogenase family protein n=1 Tax=Celeribacter halophilus TaxID=576117 RepID=UPI001C095AE8|nr:alcohol dehydrogenase family protein [Celeribacter halophilus]MBU2890395.1 alcohol dehydrogenase family protein [Celeribacter halophilus]MDO6511468.1 alcohol dehydrogenase family protein [Celeribacter halophilus]
MPLPDTMTAVLLTGHGGFDRLEYRDDVPVPRPASGEVLIRVRASAVNNTDVNTRTGWYSKAVRGDTNSAAATGYDGGSDADGGWAGALHFPLIQGADCCGEIVAVGNGVEPTRVGQRVLVRPMYHPARSDDPDALATFGSERDGAFAQFATIEAEQAIPVNSPLSDVELASFPCAFSTAEAMVQRANLGAERVLITGASGGVGSAAIQLAKRRGAHVTALTSPSKAEALRDLGADVTLGRKEALPAEAFDVVLDLVGGPRWPELLDALTMHGRYVTSGAIAGPIVDLDLRTLYLKDLTLTGSTRQPPSVFTDLVGYIERGEIRPIIAKTFPLHDIHNAQKAFLEKKHIGKIGLSIP